MPLDVFARHGQLLEVRVPWLDVTLRTITFAKLTFEGDIDAASRRSGGGDDESACEGGDYRRSGGRA